MSGTNKPLILFLNHVGSIGGAELDLIDMARHFAATSQTLLLADGPLRAKLESVGASVSVLSAPAEVRTVQRTSGALRVARTVPHVLNLARRIARRARRFDLVWANSQKSFVIGAFASAFARRPLVWHMHDILTAEHFSATNRRIAVRLANRFARCVVTVSQAGRASFIESGGRPELATIIYNGIHSAPFDAVACNQDDEEPARDRVRHELGLPDDAPVIGVFGRLTPWKGQDVLIRALPSLPGVQALFVGEAWAGEAEYAQSLRTLAEALGVADRVRYTGFRNDVPALMSAVDVIAHTSTSPEPFGRVIVEGMLARKPVVATAPGGAREIVTNREDGLLIPAGNPEALADAVRQLLEDPALAASLAAEGIRTATARFSVETFLDAVQTVATQVTERRTPIAPPMKIAKSRAHRATQAEEAVAI